MKTGDKTSLSIRVHPKKGEQYRRRCAKLKKSQQEVFEALLAVDKDYPTLTEKYL